MRILLSGATGVVGRALVPILVNAGHDVIGCTRRAQGVTFLEDHGAVGIVLDVLDHDAVSEALVSVSPDAVIHQLTALSEGNTSDNARLRRVGTRNLVDAAHASGVTRIVVQSIAWAYEPGSGPADEATPLDVGAPEPRATTIGGVQALEGAATEIAHHVVLRYGTLYGPGTSYEQGGLMARNLRAGDFVANDAVTSFVHIDDAVHTAQLALEWPPGAYTVVDNEPASARDWMPVFADAQGEPPPKSATGCAGWERGALNTKARQVGWSPIHDSWRGGFSASG